MPTIDDIVTLLETRGGSQYGGEAVTQREHALQSALLAEREAASPELIVAALLHDVGHLLHDLPADAPERGFDDGHESAGRRYLERLFPEFVTEPVRLHVEAKRYLCTIDDSYRATLSAPSIVSLQLQGGLMSHEEVGAFEANPFAEAAIRLRRWDDAAKVPDLRTPPLAHFAGYLVQVAVTESGT